MARRRNPLLGWLTTTVALLFLRATARMSLPGGRRLGRLLGSFMYYCVPSVRRRGLFNLNLAYGDTLSRRQKLVILKHAIENMAIVACELSHTPNFCAPERRPPVQGRGLHYLEGSRGLLLIGAHLGNWEWLAPAGEAAGYHIAEVVRPLDDFRLDQAIDALRRGSGIETISKYAAANEVIRRIRKGGCVGILVDQSPRENGAPVRFLGQPCWATAAPSVIWLRTKCLIHPVAMIRQPDGDYVLEIFPALDLKLTGNITDDVLAITQQCQDAIEDLVRAHPEQWLWMHRRWKERPRLAREWDARLAKRPSPDA